MQGINRPLTGLFVVPVSCGFVFYSVVTGFYLPVAVFLVALLVSAFTYVAICRWRISLELQAPSRTVEGESVEVMLLLYTRGVVPRFVTHSEVQISEPATGYDVAKGRSRQVRMFVREDGERRSTEKPEKTTVQMNGFILTRRRSRISRHLQLDHRGEVVLRSLKLYLSDPLGIFVLSKTFRINHTVLVRVRPAVGTALLSFPHGSGQLDTHMKLEESGEMLEYAGTRLYREGDELRHIHWPTVARTGELYVREYTPSAADSVIVLLWRNPRLETTDQWLQPPAGEFMIKTVAAAVIEFFNRRVHVNFGTNIGVHRELSIGYSPEALQRFHDMISALSWDESCNDGSQLGNLVYGRREQSVVLIFHVDAPDPPSLDLLPEVLRIARRRFLNVYAKESMTVNSEPGVPTDMRVLQCDMESPESLFANLK